MSNKYDDLSREELAKLLQARDRRDATRFGGVGEFFGLIGCELFRRASVRG